MSDWKKVKLSTVAKFKNGKKRPLNFGMIPVYGGNGILSYTDQSNFRNCIVIGRVGAYCGNVFFVEKDCWISDNAITALPKENVDTQFLYYLLKNLALNIHRIGSGQPLLTQGILNNLDVLFCDSQTQKKIAAVLSALDDKIELNNAINKNLEEQAQTIFKKMFPAITSVEVSVGEYITPKHGKNLRVKDAINGNVPVVAGGLEPATYHNKSNTTAPVLTIAASGNAGYVKLWNSPVWSSDSSFIDSSMTEDVYFWYVMLKLRQEEIFSLRTGTAQQHIYPKHIAQLPIKKLDEYRIKKFTKLATPLFSMIGVNIQENQKLAEIRDALLPRLMSGEIDVSGVEI